MKTIKRMAALLLAVVLVLSCLPAAFVFAAELPEETVPAATEATELPTTGTDPPVPEETTVPTAPPEETAPVETAPVETNPAEATAEPTEETAEPTEPGDESAPDAAEPVTLEAAAGSATLSLTVTPEGSDIPTFTAEEMNLEYEELDALCAQGQIPSILGAYSAQMNVTDVSGIIDLSITFSAPIPAIDESSTYVFLVHDNIIEQMVLPYVEIQGKGITKVYTPVNLSGGSLQIVILTADQPKLLVPTGYVTDGWISTKDTFGRTPGVVDGIVPGPMDRSTGKYIPIGEAVNGTMNVHCWQPPGGNHNSCEITDVALCLSHGRKWYFDRMVYEEINKDTDLGTCAPDNGSDIWRRYLSETTRSNLMLLLLYGMDTDSPYHKFDPVGLPSDLTDAKNIFAAMQLICWEWINGDADGTYTRHYSQEIQNYAAQLRSYVYNNPDNIDTHEVHIYYLSHTVAYSGGVLPNTYGYGQPMITVMPIVSPDQPLTLEKGINASPECIAQLTDNAMYSLEGAKYDVVIDENVVETITTDANGTVTTTKKFKPGTSGYVVEIEAPKGFRLDSTPVPFTIPSSGECVVQVSDVPVMDPPFAITKVDKDTTTPQGDGSFSSAVFQWEYFDNTSWSGAAKRTWYFQTDADGWARYSADFLAPDYTSDALYVNSSGQNEVPLGTVKITEIKNSLGYTVLPLSLYCSIVQSDTSPIGVDIVWTPESWEILVDMASGNFGVYEPINQEIFGSLTIQKTDKETGITAPSGATLAGCEFTVYNCSASPVKIGENDVAKSGEACVVLTVDETGKVSTGNVFPVGTYEVKETKGNDYYQCNEAWSYTFTVTGTENNPAFVTECANSMYPGAIHLQKVDGNERPILGTKFLLEWSTDGKAWKAVMGSDEIIMGGCSSPELDEDGCLTVGEDGTADFTGLYPAVQYRVTEVETANGYTLLKDPIIIEALRPEGNFECTYRVVNSDVFTLPKTGGVGFFTVIPGMILASAALLLGLIAGTKKRKI